MKTHLVPLRLDLAKSSQLLGLGTVGLDSCIKRESRDSDRSVSKVRDDEVELLMQVGRLTTLPIGDNAQFSVSVLLIWLIHHKSHHLFNISGANMSQIFIGIVHVYLE